MPLTHTYSVQVQRSMKVSAFSLALTRTVPGPATVSRGRTNPGTGDHITSPMYGRLGLIKRATDLSQEVDKDLRLVQRRYKVDYDRSIRFAPILQVGDYIFLDRPLLF